jgi:hypothetical protein
MWAFHSRRATECRRSDLRLAGARQRPWTALTEAASVRSPHPRIACAISNVAKRWQRGEVGPWVAADSARQRDRSCMPGGGVRTLRPAWPMSTQGVPPAPGLAAMGGCQRRARADWRTGAPARPGRRVRPTHHLAATVAAHPCATPRGLVPAVAPLPTHGQTAVAAVRRLTCPTGSSTLGRVRLE